MSRPRVRDDVALMDGYHSPQLDVAVRLNTNEAPESPPDGFRERVAAAVADLDWHRYPDRSAGALRARIAEVEGIAGGAEQVFAANGSNEVLQTVMLTFGGAGRTAVTFEPTYALHGHISRICGTRVVEGERTDDFALDLDHVAAVIATERPTVTFLCSPNNPTGMVETEATVRAVLDMVRDVDGLLVVDEAYGQFAPWSALSLLADSAEADDPPLVVTRTYSKTWSMAAARLGYAVAPSWLVAELDKVVLPYHLDAAKQAAGTIALDYLDEMRARVATLVEERGRVVEALGDLEVDQWSSGANFVLFRPRSRAGDDVWQSMADRGVLVRNCASWPRLSDCLRVTLGNPAENDAFLAALREALEA